MYGIIDFFKRNYFILLFATLEFFSFYFVFKNNHYHQAAFFNSANSVAGKVYTSYSGITQYFGLTQENDELAEENAKLRNVLSHLSDSNTKRKFMASNPYGQQYSYILANVVDNSTSMVDNYLTINAGKKQGITNGMGVISEGGIVGVVINVSDNFAVVMSLLNKNCQVSAMLKRDGAFGTLRWGGDDYRYATLSQIPMSEKLKAGDTITTSGYSDLFPKGVPVGNVEYYTRIPEQYFYSVVVRLSTNFKNLRYVYVISDITKIEKTQLEQNTYKKPL